MIMRRIRRMGRNIATLVMVLLLVLTAACAPAPEEITPAPPPTPEPTPTPEPIPTPAVEWGVIEIRVTDPPPADVKSAVIYFENLEVHKVDGGEGEWIPILEEGSFDLLDVIGVEAILGSVATAAGSFTQIRMDVTKVEGLTSNDTAYTATVPGEKLKIVRPFNVEDGVKTILILDFDGDKSLIVTGAGKFLFKPVVKLLIEKETLEGEEAGVE